MPRQDIDIINTWDILGILPSGAGKKALI